MTTPYPNPLTSVYCKDEDIANICLGDYTQLCPLWNKLAYGVDGVFSALDLWTLTSTSVDFEAAGVTSGHVFRLSRPSSAFKGNGELFGVASVDGTDVTLRRLGLLTGIGHPPSPAGGLTGVEFVCLTFTPQIEIAAFNINQIFGVTQVFTTLNEATILNATYSPDQMFLLRDLNTLTALWVLKGAYEIANRNANGEFALKLKQIIQDYDDTKDRISIRWGGDGQREFPSSIFGARLSR